MLVKRALISLAVLFVLLGGAAQASAQTPKLPRTEADLGVLTSGPAVVAPGDLMTYTLKVYNAGPQTALAVQWADFLPEGTTFVNVHSSAGWMCKTPAIGSTGTVVCSAARLAPNAIVTFKLTLHVNAQLPSGYTISNWTGTRALLSNDEDPDNSWSMFVTEVQAP